MTFDDDFCRFEHAGNHWLVRVQDIGIEWPPPQVIEDPGESIPGVQSWERDSMSLLTDDDRAGMSHVCRGALYRPTSHKAEEAL